MEEESLLNSNWALVVVVMVVEMMMMVAVTMIMVMVDTMIVTIMLSRASRFKVKLMKWILTLSSRS